MAVQSVHVDHAACSTRLHGVAVTKATGLFEGLGAKVFCAGSERLQGDGADASNLGARGLCWRNACHLALD